MDSDSVNDEERIYIALDAVNMFPKGHQQSDKIRKANEIG